MQMIRMLVAMKLGSDARSARGAISGERICIGTCDSTTLRLGSEKKRKRWQLHLKACTSAKCVSKAFHNHKQSETTEDESTQKKSSWQQREYLIPMYVSSVAEAIVQPRRCENINQEFTNQT